MTSHRYRIPISFISSLDLRDLFTHNMIPLALPPPMDCAPEFCFCGRKTIESHDFWFCSTECARLDTLRALDNPECHYRKVVQAYVRAGAPEARPRRMKSADHMGPSDKPFTSTSSVAQGRNVAGLPTLAQVTSKVLTRKASAGKPLVAQRQDGQRVGVFPDESSRARHIQRPSDYEQFLDDIPLPEHVPARTLRRVPGSIDGVRNDARKASVAALMNSGRSRKVKEGENSEGIFGHHVNQIVPPARKESSPWHHQINPAPVAPVQTAKALRRSASFAGWNATPHDIGGPANEHDPLMQIIEEMREEFSGESFDPRSLFEQEEDD